MKKPTDWQPPAVFTYDIVWILALLALAFVYSVQPEWSVLPHRTFAFQNVVPLWVPWAGGLGGVTISLVGVATHTVDWDASKFGYWHVSRPFLGAVCGSVAILIVVLVLRSVDPPVNGATYTPGGIAVLAVISFVVGYREETFRTLITKVVDVILAPGSDLAACPVTLVPALLDFGARPVGEAATLTANAFNGGADTIRVTAARVSIEPATGTIAVGQIADTDLVPGGVLAIALTWTPIADQVLDATLVIATESRRLTSRVKGTVQLPP